MTSLQTSNSAPDFIIAPAPPDLQPAIEAACTRVPPLWPLQNFVAVNPFLGLTNATFTQSCALMRRALHSDTLMSASFYAKAWKSGKIGAADLENARQQLHWQWHGENRAWLEIQTTATLVYAIEEKCYFSKLQEWPADAISSFSDVLSDATGATWKQFVIEEVAKWCAAYFDGGQAAWTMPWRGESLFKAWKEAATRDRNPEMAGLPGFRAFVSTLPDEPVALIHRIVSVLGASPANWSDFLHRHLMMVPGWSGAVQFRVREAGMKGETDDSLIQLLAILLAYEGALYAAFGAEIEARWHENLEKLARNSDLETPRDLLALGVWQRALENGYQRALLSRLKGQNEPKTSQSLLQPTVQSVFCIDVRSEIFRRAFEATSSAVETLGFAGFFGVALECVPLGEQNGRAQCPVLLVPAHKIHEHGGPNNLAKIGKKKLISQISGAWSDFKSAAVSGFSFVETGGLWAGVQIAQHSLGLAPQAAQKCEKLDVAGGMSLEKRVETALGALRGMSWGDTFARLVLFCGHGSHTTNNPYGSGLDCGACGGHSGQSNARVSAAIFNDPQVRAALSEKGFSIPDDTHFLAGLHITTTDDVMLFDLDELPQSHQNDLKQLQNWLGEASQTARRERAQALGLGGLPMAQIEKQVRSRSRDWAQVRPEWGLAGNAAFIAAPRERTRHLNLGGRTFLHNYDFKLDADNSILSAIMNAPMVVASWINLQYFGSTVNNAVLGSGNKTTHNVVGQMGVTQGNGGDLQSGLPFQSLHDGEKWVHEPLRLSVVIEAPRERIDAVIGSSAGVRDLVENDWLHLFALEDGGQTAYRYLGNARWQAETHRTEKISESFLK